MRRRTSAKKALTAKANQTKIANSKVSFEIESIDKQLATDYLATNFEKTFELPFNASATFSSLPPTELT